MTRASPTIGCGIEAGTSSIPSKIPFPLLAKKYATWVKSNTSSPAVRAEETSVSSMELGNCPPSDLRDRKGPSPYITRRMSGREIIATEIREIVSSKSKCCQRAGITHLSSLF
jgi:hypothetical protein